MWQSLLVLAVIILLFCYYVVGYGGMAYEFIIQLCGIALVAYLLWRVETLQALGTNRTYLSMYFSSQGTTYNAYINMLRINYFIELCRQASAAAEGQSIQAKQLANRSGYRSYRTFSVAFKQRTGQSVKDWIAEQESALQSNKQ